MPTHRSPLQAPKASWSAEPTAKEACATPSVKPWNRLYSVALEQRASMVVTSGRFLGPRTVTRTRSLASNRAGGRPAGLIGVTAS